MFPGRVILAWHGESLNEVPRRPALARTQGAHRALKEALVLIGSSGR